MRLCRSRACYIVIAEDQPVSMCGERSAAVSLCALVLAMVAGGRWQKDDKMVHVWWKAEVEVGDVYVSIALVPFERPI
jgi:hypothetical protein